MSHLVVHPPILRRSLLRLLTCKLLLLISSIVSLIRLVALPILSFSSWNRLISVDEVCRQIFFLFFVFLVVFGFRSNGREVTEIKLDPYLIHSLRKTILLLRLGLHQGNWLGNCWNVTPTLVHHIGLFEGRLERLDRWHPIVVVVVIDWSGFNCWMRHIHRIFFSDAADFIKRLVVISQLIETVWVLNNKDHSTLIESIGCLLRSDSTWCGKFRDSDQLFDCHHMYLNMFVLPAIHFFLLDCFFSKFFQKVVLVRVHSFEPTHNKSVLLSAFPNVRQHLRFTFFFANRKLCEPWID